MREFINIDDRYGDPYSVVISDYLELNPDGEFELRHDGIYEWRGGVLERVAIPREEWESR